MFIPKSATVFHSPGTIILPGKIQYDGMLGTAVRSDRCWTISRLFSSEPAVLNSPSVIDPHEICPLIQDSRVLELGQFQGFPGCLEF